MYNGKQYAGPSSRPVLEKSRQDKDYANNNNNNNYFYRY